MTKVKWVTFIGDVHGITTWDVIVRRALQNHSHVVFLGDYVDSYFLTPEQIMQNLLGIIGAKIQNPANITLLLGNHDWAYIRGKTQISGFQGAAWENYRSIFMENIDLFEVAWGYTSDFRLNKDGKPLYTLATHAGLSQTYYDFLIKVIENPTNVMNKVFEGIDYKNLPLHEFLTYFKDSEYLWKVGVDRGGSGCGGILWADKREVKEDPYLGINQVAGHTPSFAIEAVERHGNMLYFVDCHGNDIIFALELEL